MQNEIPKITMGNIAGYESLLQCKKESKLTREQLKHRIDFKIQYNNNRNINLYTDFSLLCDLYIYQNWKTQ